jgi:FkbM family methyltransferase
MEFRAGTGTERHPISIWRRAAEKISRGVVLKRHLPKRLGGRPIWLSPESSSLRAWKLNTAAVAGDLFDIAEELVRPGDVVWDIGANVGFFCFAASFMAGKAGAVLAIEPDTVAVTLLRKTASHPHPDSASVTIVPVAIGEAVKLSRFHIARRSRSANFIEGFGGTQADGFREVQVVPTITLDWLAEQLQQSPAVLKIDVEGAEPLVLLGGERLLKSARPKIYVEVTGENSDWVTQFLHRCGYHLYDGEMPKGNREILSHAAWNTIALPAEQPNTEFC